MKKLLLKRLGSDGGFMGPTHALSGVAVFFFIAAFAPNIFIKLFGAINYPLYITALILVIGGALLPDFDNVKSTAISVTGFVGQIISSAMRSSARVIYTLTRGKKDAPTADPHRMFWHTIVAAISVGFLVTLLIKSTSLIKFSVFGRPATLSILIVGFLLLVATQLTFAIFFKKSIKKISGGLGIVVSWVIGLVVTLALLSQIPATTNFQWVGIAISLGWIIHILGDTVTTAGTPLFFPLKHKGTRWWNWRCPPHIHANGPIEHYVFFPLFVLIIVISIFKIFVS